MDVALGLIWYFSFGFCKAVLILVVMDVALGQVECLSSEIHGLDVLILVVMDVALGLILY